jgi:hypothetical protein
VVARVGVGQGKAKRFEILSLSRRATCPFVCSVALGPVWGRSCSAADYFAANASFFRGTEWDCALVSSVHGLSTTSGFLAFSLVFFLTSTFLLVERPWD